MLGSSLRGDCADAPTEVSSYPAAAEVQNYLVEYAAHFHLKPHLRLKTNIGRIKFDDVQKQWAIEIEGEGVQYFDKTVIAIGGMTNLPNIPLVEGLEKFKGASLHSRAFKKPEQFKGKRVMVVGFGNTAADTATQLANVAEKVYISHRNGARIVSFRASKTTQDGLTVQSCPAESTEGLLITL